MKFKEIRIRHMDYGEHSGQIIATLSIEGKAANMQIEIPEPHSLRILKACGMIVADAGAEMAEKFYEEFMAAMAEPDATPHIEVIEKGK